MIPVIMKTLEGFASAQINLASESSRKVIAEKVLEDITAAVQVWLEEVNQKNEEPLDLEGVQISIDDYI